MADLADVETAVVNILIAALYPNGINNPSAVGSACRIYAGWPTREQLDPDLVNGVVNISVFPQPGMERVTTRYPNYWVLQTTATPTLTATVSGVTITLGGTVTVGNYATVVIPSAAGFAASYAAVGGDTLTTIAAALAAQLGNGTTSSGAVITMPAAFYGRIIARTAAPGTQSRELKRQQRSFQITIWASTPALRATVARFVDPTLAATDYLPLPDNYQAWMTYGNQRDSDEKEPSLLYRRDFFYWIEYPTTQTMAGYPITDFVFELQGNYPGDIPPAPQGANTPGFVFNPQITENN